MEKTGLKISRKPKPLIIQRWWKCAPRKKPALLPIWKSFLFFFLGMCVWMYNCLNKRTLGHFEKKEKAENLPEVSEKEPERQHSIGGSCAYLGFPYFKQLGRLLHSRAGVEKLQPSSQMHPFCLCLCPPPPSCHLKQIAAAPCCMAGLGPAGLLIRCLFKCSAAHCNWNDKNSQGS